jgi:hypothetical protein
MDPKDLLKMTEEELRARFKNYDQVALLKKKVEKVTRKWEEDDQEKKFMSKFVPCPKCRAPIDKVEG